MLERRFLGEPPDIVGETRKGCGNRLAVVEGLVVVDLECFVREIAVAAEIVLYVGVFLALFVERGLGEGSDAPCFAFGTATCFFDTEAA